MQNQDIEIVELKGFLPREICLANITFFNKKGKQIGYLKEQVYKKGARRIRDWAKRARLVTTAKEIKKNVHLITIEKVKVVGMSTHD